MVKTKREFLWGTCILSAIGVIVSLVSVGTEQWVTAEAKILDYASETNNIIEYGLFKGVMRQRFGYVASLEIIMTCSLEHNVCALLCGKNSDVRFKVLDNLYNNIEFNSSNMNECPQVRREFSVVNHRAMDPVLKSSENDDKKFINYGVVICTIMFLFLSAAFGLVSTVFSFWNIAFNPIDFFLSVKSLYIYNAAAAFCTFLYILMWGVLYATTIIYDVNIQYTLVGSADSKGRAFLGYSYWISIIPLTLYLVNIGLLYTRDYQISKQPPVHLPIEDAADPALYIY